MFRAPQTPVRRSPSVRHVLLGAGRGGPSCACQPGVLRLQGTTRSSSGRGASTRARRRGRRGAGRRRVVREARGRRSLRFCEPRRRRAPRARPGRVPGSRGQGSRSRRFVRAGCARRERSVSSVSSRLEGVRPRRHRRHRLVARELVGPANRRSGEGGRRPPRIGGDELSTRFDVVTHNCRTTEGPSRRALHRGRVDRARGQRRALTHRTPFACNRPAFRVRRPKPGKAKAAPWTDYPVEPPESLSPASSGLASAPPSSALAPDSHSVAEGQLQVPSVQVQLVAMTVDVPSHSAAGVVRS